MKISIIIPSYNLKKYIKRTIDSVLSQPYEDKECIVIDGGSTDNTVNILKEYGDKIIWISEKDNGQADAINKGFKIATGDIVAWLNADDYYAPNIFENISKEFLDGKYSLIYGNCHSVFENGKIILNTPPKNVTAEKLINKGNLLYQPSTFYRMSDIKKVNYVDDKLNYWMEYDLYIKLLKEKPAKYIDVILSKFTIRDDQKSNISNSKEMDREIIQISKKFGGGGPTSKLYWSCLFHKLGIRK